MEKVTKSVKDEWFNREELGKSVREVEEFNVHPNQIKQLGQGQAFIVKRNVNAGYGIVKLHKAPSGVDEAFMQTLRDLMKNRAGDIQRYRTIQLQSDSGTKCGNTENKREEEEVFL